MNQDKKTIINLEEIKDQRIDELERKQDPHFINKHIELIRSYAKTYDSTHTYKETMKLLNDISFFAEFLILDRSK